MLKADKVERPYPTALLPFYGSNPAIDQERAAWLDRALNVEPEATHQHPAVVACLQETQDLLNRAPASAQTNHVGDPGMRHRFVVA